MVFILKYLFLLNLAGVQLVLSPKKKLKCMTEDNKKELVSCILSYVAGSNFGDKNSNLQLESHFIDQKTHYIKGMWVVGCVCVCVCLIFFSMKLYH